jgi:hypothetical protein
MDALTCIEPFLMTSTQVSARGARQTVDTPTTLYVITYTPPSRRSDEESSKSAEIRQAHTLCHGLDYGLCKLPIRQNLGGSAGFYCIKRLTQFLELIGHSHNIPPAIFVIALAKLSEKSGFLTATIVAIEPSC